MAAFSMTVRKPKEGDSHTANRIRAEAGSYLTEAGDMAERETGRQDLVERYRRELEKLSNGRDPRAAQGDESKDRTRRKQRTRRDRNPGAASPPQSDVGRDE